MAMLISGPESGVVTEPIASAKPWLSNGKLIGLGVAAMGLLVEDVLPRHLWRERTTEVIGDTGEWLATAGLGKSDAHFVAEGLESQLGQIDYLKYSQKGISPKSVGEALIKYYEKSFYGNTDEAKRQNVIAHSMGLPTYLQGIEWCVENGAEVPPIKNIIAVSSPLSCEDTFRPKSARLVARSRYPGGVASKVIVESINNCMYDGFKPHKYWHYLMDAIRTSCAGVSPRLWVHQVGFLCRKLEPGALQGVINNNTTIYHFGDVVGDKTSNIERSRKSIEELANSYGALFVAVDTPGLGHANIPGSAPYIESALGARLSER